MTYVRRAPRRPPRSDELAFLSAVAASPPSLADCGPVGRCVKRGWCELLFETSSGGSIRRSELQELSPQEQPEIARMVGYVLTEAGRRALGINATAEGAPQSHAGSKPLQAPAAGI